MNNGETYNFNESVSNNIEWIKELAIEHDCSQGLIANAVLMTMLMMDRHNLTTMLALHGSILQKLEVLLCPSDSVQDPSKV